MGFVFTALALTSEQAEGVVADRGLLERLVCGSVGVAGPDGVWVADLDTSWDAVHIFLTGTDTSSADADRDSPLGMAILGGREIGEGLGLESVRLLEPVRVRVVAQALGALDHNRLGRGFDREAFLEWGPYPAGAYDELDWEDILEELLASIFHG